MFFTIALCFFLITGIVIFSYLMSSSRLFDDIQNYAPEIWEKLGKPKRIFVHGMRTIQPIFPWIAWIWKGETEGLPSDIACSLIKSRRLFKGSLVLFFLTVVFILLSITMGE